MWHSHAVALSGARNAAVVAARIGQGQPAHVTIIISRSYDCVNMQHDQRLNASALHFNRASISLTVAQVPHEYTVYAFLFLFGSNLIATILH